MPEDKEIEACSKKWQLATLDTLESRKLSCQPAKGFMGPREETCSSYLFVTMRQQWLGQFCFSAARLTEFDQLLGQASGAS